MCFQKWYEEFARFSPKHFKVSELGFWLESFVQSWKCISLKITGELCVMTMNNYAKVKRNWLASSKFTSGIWQFLTWALKNRKKLHFKRLHLTKAYNVWAKKVQRSYVWRHSTLIQNLKENWLLLSKITQGLGKISPEHSKVSKLGLCWDSFIQSRKFTSLKFKVELVVCHDNEEWYAKL